MDNELKQILVQLLWLLALVMFWPVVLLCPVAFIMCACYGIWIGAGISGGLFASLLIFGIWIDIKERGFKKHMLDTWIGINFKEDNNG